MEHCWVWLGIHIDRGSSTKMHESVLERKSKRMSWITMMICPIVPLTLASPFLLSHLTIQEESFANQITLVVQHEYSGDCFC